MTSGSLVRQRKALKLSQVRLALLSGVSRYRLQNFEIGYIKLTKIEIANIKAVLTGASNCGLTNKKSKS